MNSPPSLVKLTKSVVFDFNKKVENLNSKKIKIKLI